MTAEGTQELSSETESNSSSAAKGSSTATATETGGRRRTTRGNTSPAPGGQDRMKQSQGEQHRGGTEQGSPKRHRPSTTEEGPPHHHTHKSSPSRSQHRHSSNNPSSSGALSDGEMADRARSLSPPPPDRAHDLVRHKKESTSELSLLEQLTSHSRTGGRQHNSPLQSIRRVRLFCGQLVEDVRVQIFIILLILTNAVMMGIATFDFVTDDPETDKAFDTADRVFLILFTIELALQLIYRSITFFTDSWLIFDFIIVVISWSMESLQIVRAFRVFRAFRLVTRIESLRELVMALGAVMPRMYAIAMLLFLIFYIFAVLFTELFSELDLSDNFFGSLDVSLFTCMEMMTLEWSDVTREVMDQKSWAWAPMLSFISITGFIVFNLIVAVVCDAVAVVDREAFAEKYPEIQSDKQRLEEAQERIWELTETVEILMMRQERLLSVTDTLTKEVRSMMSPAAVAASTTGPPLRSAMRNSAQNASAEAEGEILHFSDESDADEKEVPDASENPDDSTAQLESNVHKAVERMTRASDGSRTSYQSTKQDSDVPKMSKLNGRRPPEGAQVGTTTGVKQ